MLTTTGENEVALSLFCDFGIFLFIISFLIFFRILFVISGIYGEKRKANIFENFTCQQVNKAKNFGDSTILTSPSANNC